MNRADNDGTGGRYLCHIRVAHAVSNVVRIAGVTLILLTGSYVTLERASLRDTDHDKSCVNYGW